MNKLRELRLSKNLTMKEFGALFGVAESTISLYETGKRQADNVMLLKIADFFDVTVDYLLGRTDEADSVAPSGFVDLSSDEQDVIECMRNVGAVEREIIVETAKNVNKAFQRNKKAGIV